MSSPPNEVISCLEEGRCTTLRRVEFYESDGETPWFPAGDDEPESRLEGGSVSIDYNRSERRALDLSLDNIDNALRPDSAGGLWYDKVIKVFRGLRYQKDKISPNAAIVFENTAGDAQAFKVLLQSLGFSNIDILLSATTVAELADYDIIMSIGHLGEAQKLTLINDLYTAGKNVITTGALNTQATHPLITSVSAQVNIIWGVDHPPYDTPIDSGWTAEFTSFTNGRAIVSVRGTAVPVAQYLHSGVVHHTVVIEENSAGGKWAHFQLPEHSTQSKILLKNVYDWLWGYVQFANWETQIGEYLIDNIQEAHFPHIIKLTGRDYTKKCLGSKLETSMSFASGTPLELLVQALAANAGITKFALPLTEITLSSRMDFDRGTERWKVIESACNAHNYEVYFTEDGFLTMREFLDPVHSPTALTLQTGPDGNLASFDRSLNDSRLYNHVIVTGETSVEGALPFFGEARNDEPSSPTRIQRIGDRSYFFTSSFFTSSEQCEQTALNMLKLHALESYELNFSSVAYPWLGVGEIVEFLDPRRLDSEPTRFLLDSLTIPLSLGPMSGTGKRVTFVNDSSLVGAEV